MSLDRLRRRMAASMAAFQPRFAGETVLTEAACGDYAVTPVLAALAGARVLAFGRDSRWGSFTAARRAVQELADLCGVAERIVISDDLASFDLERVAVVTNTGFLRPLDRAFVASLSTGTVIPLMWEPWEHRPQELDLEACRARGIKVYGTNEEDPRLRTREYIGYIVLRLLLQNRCTPRGGEVLLLGGGRFPAAVAEVLQRCGYRVRRCGAGDPPPEPSGCEAIVVAEHEDPVSWIGPGGRVEPAAVPADTVVIHICGRVDFAGAPFRHVPDEPASFGRMSYTTDWIDSAALTDLHTAGLKVAEGMLRANRQGLRGADYRAFMEENYPALAFADERFW